MLATVALPSFDADHGFADLHRASPVERIAMVRAGVTAGQLKRLIAALDLDQRSALDALNLRTATVNRKAARGEVLAPDDSERVLGLARLVGQLEEMVADGGDSTGFDAPAWLSRWLREPLPALGGERPIGLLDTMEGQALVARALAQAGSGAFA